MSDHRRSVAIGAGVLVLALAGGVAAQFTTSTSSPGQRIGTGTVAIDFQNESVGWDTTVEYLAAGDTYITTVDFVNTGSLELMDLLRLTVTDDITDGLTADLNGAETRDDSLRLKITAPRGVVFDGHLHELLGPGHIIPAGLLGLGAADRTPLTFAYTVPASAENIYQDRRAVLTFKVEAIQRSSFVVDDNNDAVVGQPVNPTAIPTSAPTTNPTLNPADLPNETFTLTESPTQGGGPRPTSTSSSTSSAPTETTTPGGGGSTGGPGSGTTPGSSSPAPVGTPYASMSWTNLGNHPADFSFSGESSVQIGQSLYFFGYNPTTEANSSYRYDMGDDSWHLLSSIAPHQKSSGGPVVGATGLSTAVASPDGSSIYLVGVANGDLDAGQLDVNSHLSVFRYDVSANTWSQLPDMNQYRINPVVKADNEGNLFVMGGHLGKLFGADDPLAAGANTADRYNAATGTWTLSTIAARPTDTSSYYSGGAVGADGRIYFAGGIDYDTFSPLANFDAYDPATNTWQVLAPMYQGRYVSALKTGPDGKMYALGGVGSDFLNTAEVYDPATGSWLGLPLMNTGRYSVAVGFQSNSLPIVFGGLNASDDRPRNFERLG